MLYEDQMTELALLSLNMGRLSEDCITALYYVMRVQREDRATTLSGAQEQDSRQWTQVGMQMPVKQEVFHC